MLKALDRKNEPYVFNPNPASHRSVLLNLRRKVANRLQNPRLKGVHLHSFRHWKAAMEFAKTEDVLWVAYIFGHKNIKNTQIYMHLVDFRSKEEYHSAVATTIDEARKLIESGFHFVCNMDGAKLFSKRK